MTNMNKSFHGKTPFFLNICLGKESLVIMSLALTIFILPGHEYKGLW